jgi:hypothetical protein
MPSVKKSVPSDNRQKTDKRPAPRTAFAPGKSGNPGGRPKKTQAEYDLEAACREKTPDALGVMVRLMSAAKQDSVKLQAALSIIERAHGKPLQRSEVRTGPLDGLPPDEAKALLDAIDAIQQARTRSAVAGSPSAPARPG